MPPTPAENPEQEIIHGERAILDAVCPGWDAAVRCCLRALMRSALTYRQREVLLLRFSCGADGQPYSVAEVARIFKVTKAEAREIESDALQALRRAITPP